MGKCCQTIGYLYGLSIFICMINRLNQPAILTIKKLRILSNVVLLGALWGLYTPVQSVHQNTEEALSEHAR